MNRGELTETQLKCLGFKKGKSRWTGKEEWQWGTQTITEANGLGFNPPLYEPILRFDETTSILSGQIDHEFGSMTINKKVTEGRHLELAMELASVTMSNI